MITVEGLEPFTHYVFRVAAETVYNTRLGQTPYPGPEAVFKTKAKGEFRVKLILRIQLGLFKAYLMNEKLASSVAETQDLSCIFNFILYI